jgi:valyl-tRNA synthetase
VNIQKYDPKIIENENSGACLNGNKDKHNFLKSILMPPPNITGNLHIGHSLDLAIQDFIVRSSFLKGEKINWISGFDHAGIATQSKIESLGLLDSGKNIVDKSKFVIEKWYPQQKENFIKQWQNLGLFVNYSQDNFTMNLDVQEKIKSYFILLYNDGLIYQNNKVINWDVKLQTAVSDIEVDSINVDGMLFYVKYFFSDIENKYLEVATSRPETIFADVALFVNPNDYRYSKYIGTFVINPLNNKKIKIFSSEKVKIDFGTGVLKCTPSHDFDDYELAQLFNLPLIECYDKKGIFNDLAGKWKGKDARNSRREIVEFLRDNNFLVKEEKYQTKENISQRSNSIVEPLVSLQWFLNLPLMIERIEESNPNFLDEINFLPFSTKDKILAWKYKIKEWCISRQLWWGHQIPIWHNINDSKITTAEDKSQEINWKKDADVLDTWFSSSLWPLIVSTKQNEFIQIDYLVTGSDLLFFWLFKMIIFSFYFYNKSPFKNVIIHGLIRDKLGKKMSKSLGNGIEPEEIISKYSADTLRLFLLSNNVHGADLKFDEDKLKGCYFFLQKLWSVFNFIVKNSHSNELISEIKWDDLKNEIEGEEKIFNKVVNFWIINELEVVEKTYNESTFIDNSQFDTSLISRVLIDFTKEKISSSYIYLVKSSLNDLNIKVLTYVFQRLLLMFNPFVPFITNYIYEKIFTSKIEKFLLVNYNLINKNKKLVVVNIIFILKNKIISFCKKNKIINSKVKFLLKLTDYWKNYQYLIELFLKELEKNEEVVIIVDGENFQSYESDFIDVSPFGILYFSFLNSNDIINGKNRNLEFYDNEIKRSLLLLNNQGFLNKAPKHLIESEKKKLFNYCEQKKKVLIEFNKKGKI